MVKHLNDVNMTWFEHLKFACGLAACLFLCSMALIIHGLCPCIFIDYGSTKLKELNVMLQTK